MIGDEILHKYARGLDGYDAITDIMEQKAFRYAIWEQLNAYLLLRGADQAKYGTLNKGIATQYLLMDSKGKPIDQYPKTLAHATDALANYGFDEKCYEKKKKKRHEKLRAHTRRRRQRKEELCTEGRLLLLLLR